MGKYNRRNPQRLYLWNLYYNEFIYYCVLLQCTVSLPSSYLGDYLVW